MRNFFFIFLITFALITLPVKSEIFDKITVSGNKRISSETIIVFSNLPSNKFLNENGINNVLRNLYQSGFFKDLTVKIQNKNLIIEVVENPIIQTVFIEGIKKNQLLESIKETLVLKDRSSFNLIKLKNDEEKILDFLKNKGYFFSTITSTTRDLQENIIDLIYKIDLGDKAKISKINFIGDKKFKDSKLRNVIISEEYRFWKFISGKKFLNENIVNLDARLLRNFYKNNGYYNANIESSFANYLNNNEFELIFNIESGNKYYFNDLRISLPLDYDVDDFDGLKFMLDELKGKPYSFSKIDNILNEIDKIVLIGKYVFLKSDVNEVVKDNLIDLTFNIGESKKLYVEKINIYGNNVTREQVLRNNFSIDEGDAFNELLYKKTINNLKSLNFFKNVKSEVVQGLSDNQQIINITVEEKPTGEISAGAGVGTNGGSVAFGISENNFLGRGIEFGTDLSISAESVKGLISLNNPNYKGTDKALNLSAESTVTDRLKDYGYESAKIGFTVGSGYEIYEDLFFNSGVSIYVEDLETDSTASANLKKQEGSFFDAYLNYNFNYDKRDQKFQPKDGFVSRFTQNVPIVSENYSLINSYNLKFYNEFFKESVSTFGFYIATANSLNGNNIKLSERLFIPSNKLRGFEAGKIGPKDNADFIGGNYAYAFNASTSIPQILPNSENSNFSIFFDAGNVWGVDYFKGDEEGSSLRSSIGIAVDLFTAIGPLSFSLSEVISKKNNDKTESFRFNLGTTF